MRNGRKEEGRPGGITVPQREEGKQASYLKDSTPVMEAESMNANTVKKAGRRAARTWGRTAKPAQKRIANKATRKQAKQSLTNAR